MQHIGLRVADSWQQQQCADLQKHATQTAFAKGVQPSNILSSLSKTRVAHDCAGWCRELVLGTQNAPSSQTLKCFILIKSSCTASPSKEKPCFLACMQRIWTLCANLSMLPQGESWWGYTSTEQVCIITLPMHLSFCPHASPITVTWGSHGVHHPLRTDASGCQQTHVRFVGRRCVASNADKLELRVKRSMLAGTM